MTDAIRLQTKAECEERQRIACLERLVQERERYGMDEKLFQSLFPEINLAEQTAETKRYIQDAKARLERAVESGAPSSDWPLPLSLGEFRLAAGDPDMLLTFVPRDMQSPTKRRGGRAGRRAMTPGCAPTGSH